MISTSEFDEYQVDHLFLLIGENPLPNYVAARLLLKERGTPYLVYTTHTEKAAERLAEILDDEGINTTQFVSLNDYESDAYQIKETIFPRLEAIQDGTIGLNYTGGTKAMAVHAYRTVLSLEHIDTVFSYLDPRRLEMCIDQEDSTRIRLKVKPDVLQVKLDKLFQIHDLKLKSSPTQEAQLPNLATALAEVIQDDDQGKRWREWYGKTFREEARKKKQNGEWGNWKSQTALMEMSISLDNLPQEILTAFSKKKFLTPDNQLAFSTIQKQSSFTKLEHFCKWLDGLWLEHYVLQQVKNIAEPNSINDYGFNFELPLQGTKDGFEFDVAFTRGYQLFALSVSTAKDRKLCKSKLFEAYLRAKQMGGDEARVALICCTDEPESLKAEIVNSLSDKKITVFGRQDLMDLADKIEKWIEKNDKDAR